MSIKVDVDRSIEYVKNDEFMWLVGWLEGEGCFSLSMLRGLGYARIQVVSTDKDTIEKANAIFNNFGTVCMRYTRVPSNVKHNTTWQLTIRGAKAIEWMHSLLPYMSERRQEKIKEVLLEDAMSRFIASLNRRQGKNTQRRQDSLT